MRVRRLGIRDLVTLIMVVCSLGGLALSFGLAFSFKSFQIQSQGLEQSSLTLQDLGVLRRALAEWFPAVDQAVQLGDAYSGEARLRARGILHDLRTIESRPLAEPFREDLVSLELRINKILEGLDLASLLPVEGEERERKLTEIRAGLALLSKSVDRSFDRLEGGLENRMFHLSESLTSQRSYLGRLTLGGAALYLLLVLGLWRWAIRNIIRPLLRLTAEARHCLSKRTPFRLAPAGPLEVRRLTESVSSLVDDLQVSRDNLEEKVRARTSELERANQTKNEFLAKVTHEIRTPMTGILGYAELCRRPETTEEERLEYLYTISIIENNARK